MDKSGDEHLVALQRLENELRLVRERVALALPHLEGHKFFAYYQTSLGGTLGGAASIAEDIQKLKPFWKDLDHSAIDELAEAAGTVAANVERFLGLRSQGRKVGKQEAKSISWNIHSYIQSMSKGRTELDVRRVHAVFDPAGSASTSIGDESTDCPSHQNETTAPDREPALQLAEDIELHKEKLLRSARTFRLFDHPDTLKYAIGAILMAVTLGLRFAEGIRSAQDRLGLYLNIALLLMCLALVMSAVSSYFTLKQCAKARARLMAVASDHIRQTKGHVASDAIAELIAYAWSHRDDWTTKPKEIVRKTEELKALIAGTPPSGPTAIATQ
jgi:hypothetical protein